MATIIYFLSIFLYFGILWAAAIDTERGVDALNVGLFLLRCNLTKNYDVVDGEAEDVEK